MKSIWTGAISLSLINLPVKLSSAANDNSLGLHLVRKRDGSPVNFTRVAERDGREVPWSETGKGFYAPDGSLVVLDDKDFEKAYGPKNRVAEVLMFTDASNIPPMAVKKAYWVQPDTGGTKTYALLASALQQTNKVAVITFAMRQRVGVAVLRAQDGYLSLEALNWDADLIKPDFAAPPLTASQAEQDLALQLIEQMTDKYDHSLHTDRSSEAVMDIIADKIKHGQVIAAPPRPAGTGSPIDLTASLQAAVEAHKGKGETPATTRKPRAPRNTTATTRKPRVPQRKAA